MQVTFNNEEQAKINQAAEDQGKLQDELVHDLVIDGLG
jgi:hypothetical protein